MIQPLGDRLLIEPSEAEDKSAESSPGQPFSPVVRKVQTGPAYVGYQHALGHVYPPGEVACAAHLHQRIPDLGPRYVAEPECVSADALR